MREFKGKVAVITGAASGIGRALAVKSMREGMGVVLADVDAGGLAQAERAFQAEGARTLAVQIDVTRPEDWEHLARRVKEGFGTVDLFFNNAGVAVESSVLRCSLTDWQWVMDVNLWGVIHGVRTFVPLMLAQGTPGHIVNTASIAGLFAALGPYSVTKFGVVALSEALRRELNELNAPVKVSVLCPAWVKTGIFNSERVRPAAYQGASVGSVLSTEREEANWAQIASQSKVISPATLADGVFEAIREERFYVLTDPAFNDNVRQRMEEILDPRNVIEG